MSQNNTPEFDPELQSSVDAGAKLAENAKDMRKENVKGLIRNPSTRPKVLFTGALLLGVMGVSFAMLNKNSPADLGSAYIEDAKGVQSESAGPSIDDKSSEEYRRVMDENQKEQAKYAKEDGNVFVALPDPELVVIDDKKKGVDVEVPPSPPAPPPENNYQASQQNMQVAPPVYVRDTTMDASMKNQFDAIVGSLGAGGVSYKVVPRTANQLDTASATQARSDVQGTSSTSTTKAKLVEAGEVFMATTDIEANSDESGEILATIQSGKYKGAKVLGSFNATAQDKLVLMFTGLSIPGGSGMTPIKAVAIDPDTSKKGMATEVDRHYFQRFGLLLASGFVRGLGEAARRANTTISSSGLGSVATQGALNSSQTLTSAAGTMAESVQEELRSRSKVNTTVIISAGHPIGILFMADANETK